MKKVPQNFAELPEKKKGTKKQAGEKHIASRGKLLTRLILHLILQSVKCFKTFLDTGIIDA